MQIPFFNNIADSEVVLIAGAGGGFDIASGIPLYKYLRGIGKEVILANLSFTQLVEADIPMITQGLYPVTNRSRDLPYFPEKLILQWLQKFYDEVYMYAFSNRLGVAPLRKSYLELIKKHNVDTLILVDGGTDSLMFGDESGVGTIIEDSCSLVATANLPVKQSYLVATAFGIERNHNLNHYSCLENISTLIKADEYQGCFSLMKEMSEGQFYIDLVKYLNEKQPHAMSIVSNAITSSIQGEFGDYHPTNKTQGSEQFINPLMGLYWFFELEAVASRIRYEAEIQNSERMTQVIDAYRAFRATAVTRPERDLPL